MFYPPGKGGRSREREWRKGRRRGKGNVRKMRERRGQDERERDGVEGWCYIRGEIETDGRGKGYRNALHPLRRNFRRLK